MTQATPSSTPPAPSPTSNHPPLRVAVTGGSGNIGTAVVREMLRRGHDVVILDRQAPRVEGARFVFIDLRDRQALQPVLERVEAVIHLGEIPNENRGESPHDVYVRNTAAGSTVLQTAADLKLKRVIYTSSCQVYGIWGGDEALEVLPVKFPIDESQPLNPQNPYALAKVANEGYARVMARRHGLPVSIFRLPLVISSGKFARQMYKWISRPEWSRESTDGFWTFVHQEDVARGYAQAIERTPVDGTCEAFNLISTDLLGHEPLRDRLVQRANPNLPPLPPDWPERAAPVDVSKALTFFGWSPKYTFAELAREAEAPKPDAPKPG